MTSHTPWSARSITPTRRSRCGSIRIFPAARPRPQPTPLAPIRWEIQCTATRLGSGGSGTVTWDNLIIAREWSALSKFPWITPDSTIRIVDTSFDTATRTFSLTWESSDTATYTLWESPDLSDGSWTELDNVIPGDAGATTTYPVSGIVRGPNRTLLPGQ